MSITETAQHTNTNKQDKHKTNKINTKILKFIISLNVTYTHTHIITLHMAPSLSHIRCTYFVTTQMHIKKFQKKKDKHFVCNCYIVYLLIHLFYLCSHKVLN